MNPPVLGLDLAQATFVAALQFSEQQVLQQSFANTPSGFRKLGVWLHQHLASPLRVGLECTNTYAEPLAEWLHQHGHTVHLLNPERLAHYAKAIGQRNKTDPADAVTIAEYLNLLDERLDLATGGNSTNYGGGGYSFNLAATYDFQQRLKGFGVTLTTLYKSGAYTGTYDVREGGVATGKLLGAKPLLGNTVDVSRVE